LYCHARHAQSAAAIFSSQHPEPLLLNLRCENSVSVLQIFASTDLAECVALIEDFKRNLGASFAGAPVSDVPERPRDHEHAAGRRRWTSANSKARWRLMGGCSIPTRNLTRLAPLRPSTRAAEGLLRTLCSKRCVSTRLSCLNLEKRNSKEGSQCRDHPPLLAKRCVCSIISNASYNAKRRHSTIGDKSPMQFEMQAGLV
jgi:hypothetical protein